MAWIVEYHGARKHTWTVCWRDHGEKQRQQTFSTKPEGAWEPERIVFNEWWDRWQDEVVAHLTKKVRFGYAAYGRNNLLPFFGDYELGAIRRSTITSWIRWAERRHVGPWSVHESFVVLRSCLGYAVEMEMLSTNPCTRMTKYLPPKPPPRVRPHLDSKDVMALAGAVHPRYRCMILAMGVLALRPGEAIGLRIEDVADGKVTISRSVVNAGGTMHENPTTKTGRSRSVPLMFLAPEFDDHLERWVTS